MEESCTPHTSIPNWSRLLSSNADGILRCCDKAKCGNLNIEIQGRLWSIWGCLPTKAPCFEQYLRGKQALACNVVACCAASMLPIEQWTPKVLDAIVVNGTDYYRRAKATKRREYMKLHHLGTTCPFGNVRLNVDIKYAAYGNLGRPRNSDRMNLTTALKYFFQMHDFGILECRLRYLTVGRTEEDGGYFMYDCMSSGKPLFPKNEGASYLLYTHDLSWLVYCIGTTLKMSKDAVFHIYSVDSKIDDKKTEAMMTYEYYLCKKKEKKSGAISTKCILKKSISGK